MLFEIMLLAIKLCYFVKLILSGKPSEREGANGTSIIDLPKGNNNVLDGLPSIQRYIFIKLLQGSE